MKKQIISLLLLISLSFQSTYPAFERVKQTAASISEYLKGKKDKMAALYKKFGKKKVDSDIAEIKKQTPKGIIARHNEALEEQWRTFDVYKACVKKSCETEQFKKLNLGANRRFCENFGKLHCRKEYLVAVAAEQRAMRSGFLVALAITLGVVVVSLGATVIGAVAINKMDEKEARLDEQSTPVKKLPSYEEVLEQDIEESLQESRKLMEGIGIK